MIDFYKYEGAGNDFIMVANLNNEYSGDKIELARRLCDRHFGIGSDGLIFIEKSEGCDFLMDFYNPDGSQSFCGNGSRCAVAFAKFLNCFQGVNTKFKAIDGMHTAEHDGNLVKVNMQDVSEVKKLGDDVFIHTGSPHYIIEVKNLEKIDLISEGRKVRYDPGFEPGGTNVNFIQELNENTIAIRTYERGVENETLACGTGATAAVLAFAVKSKLQQSVVNVKAIGGDLRVYFESNGGGFTNVYLEGPAKFVFKGSIDD